MPRARRALLALVTIVSPGALLSSGNQVHYQIPDAPYINLLTRECSDGSTTLTFTVLRYQREGREWTGAEGTQTVGVQGRGGSARFIGWTTFQDATTEAHGGMGWITWDTGVPLPYQMRIVLRDGTASVPVSQPEGCTR